jgi:hypothetical protein
MLPNTVPDLTSGISGPIPDIENGRISDGISGYFKTKVNNSTLMTTVLCFEFGFRIFPYTYLVVFLKM